MLLKAQGSNVEMLRSNAAHACLLNKFGSEQHAIAHISSEESTSSLTTSMTWRGKCATNLDLIKQLRANADFKSDAVFKAMTAVDRADFCRRQPYMDAPEGIGHGATISAPHMHAIALEQLQSAIKPGARVLDVGSGSGYLAVCFAHMVGEDGRVIGIDHIQELVDLSIINVRKNHASLLDSGRLKLIVGDGRDGYVTAAPFNAIHVGAAAAEIPKALLDQLAVGGKIVLPLGYPSSELAVLRKDADGQLHNEPMELKVSYVPLTDAAKQLSNA